MADEHQRGSQFQALDSASNGPSIDSWSERDQRIIVSQPAAGFLYDLILRAKLDAAPQDVYNVLIDPRSHKIFRGIKDTLSRTTLEDNGKGCRKLKIKHRALTKFLWISVTFDTELYVWEDDNERTIKFTNARSDGFMKKFDGVWHVQPFTQQTLDGIYKQQPGQQHLHAKFDPQAALSGMQQRLSHVMSPKKQQSQQQALVTLEQALAPRVTPPGPVAHLVRGLCARVLQNMMADLRVEVHKRQEAAEEDVATDRSVVTKSSRKSAAASLPIASITAASSFSGSTGSPYSRQHNVCATQLSNVLNSRRLKESAGFLPDLLAAAVPLEITIRL